MTQNSSIFHFKKIYERLSNVNVDPFIIKEHLNTELGSWTAVVMKKGLNNQSDIEFLQKCYEEYREARDLLGE